MNELKKIAKSYYHNSKTYGEFRSALIENVPEKDIEELWTYFSQQPTYKVRVKNLKK